MKWYFDEKKWYYFVAEQGKKIGKRYTEEDLRLPKNAKECGRNFKS